MNRVLGWPVSQLLPHDSVVEMKTNEENAHTDGSQSVVTEAAAIYLLGPQ